MKKYKIKFVINYDQHEEKAEHGSAFFREFVDGHQKNVKLCKKWRGKSVTILELETLTGEFEKVIFDGETIEICNGCRMVFNNE